MKKTIISIVILAFTTLFSLQANALNVSVSVGSNSSVWRCEASNLAGNRWYGVAGTRVQARNVAIRLCERSTFRWNRCRLDYCNLVQQRKYSGNWQCNAASADGQVWFGTGNSSASARYTALRYCRASSSYPRSCDTISCFRRF